MPLIKKFLTIFLSLTISSPAVEALSLDLNCNIIAFGENFPVISRPISEAPPAANDLTAKKSFLGKGIEFATINPKVFFLMTLYGDAFIMTSTITAKKAWFFPFLAMSAITSWASLNKMNDDHEKLLQRQKPGNSLLKKPLLENTDPTPEKTLKERELKNQKLMLMLFVGIYSTMVIFNILEYVL